jgi:hypothetical protein
LVQAAEAGRLQALLDGAHIGNLVLKGAAVEMLAYGGLGRKQSWDIDLLVSPAAVAAARKVLESAGYALTQPPGLSPSQFDTFVALARECEFLNRDNGITVELHWGLADGPVFIPSLNVASPRQYVPLTGGLRLLTLAPEEQFAYLCVHGAMHGWSRLKWLADLAALLSKENPQSIEQLYRRSLELGAGLCSAQALVLCHRLLGTQLGPDLTVELERTPGVSWLVRQAMDIMCGGDAALELDSRPLAGVRILLMQLVLCGSWRGAVTQMRYRAVSVHDRVVTPLPRRLEFLYPVLRPPLWLWRRFAGTRL